MDAWEVSGWLLGCWLDGIKDPLQGRVASITLWPMHRQVKPNPTGLLTLLLGVLVLVHGLWSCASAIKPEAPRPTPAGILFTLSAPDARQVTLVGSFNRWEKTVTPMTRQSGDVWSVVVPMKEGEHTFMYLIDGVRWVTPPHAEDFVTDGFGQTNGVVIAR